MLLRKEKALEILFGTIFIGITFIIISILFSKESSINSSFISTIGVAFYYAFVISPFFVMLYKISVRPVNRTFAADRNVSRIGSIYYRFHAIKYKYRVFTIIILYLLLICITIGGFAAIYKCNNLSAAQKYETPYVKKDALFEGLYSSNGFIDKESLIKSTQTEEFLYFSSVTFFTVGYGDLILVGRRLKMIVQLEMLTNYIFTAIILPLIFAALSNKER